jgi:hypothetical protein
MVFQRPTGVAAEPAVWRIKLSRQKEIVVSTTILY